VPLDGLWVGADGSTRPVRLKGGPLFEAFHGLTGGRERNLSGASGDLARAYTCAVWAYRCIKLRADAVAGVPLVLLDRSGAQIVEHPLLTLLRDANPFTMNLGDLLRATEAAYNIWGAAYWLKVRQPGRRNAIRWLVWLNPQTVEPLTDPVRGITGYRQTVGAQRREYAPEDVIVFRNFDPCDDLGGLSPLAVALSEVNAELNAARYVAAFFANDARPAGLLTTDQALPEADIERVRSWWQRLFLGAGNKWRTGIVGGGLKWQTISFPPSNLALAELRAEDRRSICAVFGVPPGMAGAWEATTYATAREQKASFYEDTILPQLEYLAETLNCSLLPHYPDLTARGARLAWDTDSIAALRETATDRARRLAMLYRAGVITRDEARAELGMPAQPQADIPAPDASAPDLPPQEKGEALKAELARWERFALRRIRTGRALRPFESAVIPPALRDQIGAALASARTAEEVRRVFAAAGEGT
jgi:HK97 family phage portal protein